MLSTSLNGSQRVSDLDMTMNTIRLHDWTLDNWSPYFYNSGLIFYQEREWLTKLFKSMVRTLSPQKAYVHMVDPSGSMESVIPLGLNWPHHEYRVEPIATTLETLVADLKTLVATAREAGYYNAYNKYVDVVFIHLTDRDLESVLASQRQQKILADLLDNAVKWRVAIILCAPAPSDVWDAVVERVDYVLFFGDKAQRWAESYYDMEIPERYSRHTPVGCRFTIDDTLLEPIYWRGPNLRPELKRAKESKKVETRVYSNFLKELKRQESQ